jgi:hypothetical protein
MERRRKRRGRTLAEGRGEGGEETSVKQKGEANKTLFPMLTDVNPHMYAKPVLSSPN